MILNGFRNLRAAIFRKVSNGARALLFWIIRNNLFTFLIRPLSFFAVGPYMLITDAQTSLYTLFDIACEHRYFETLPALVKAGVDINLQGADGNTLLHVAIQEENIDLPYITALVKAGIDLNIINDAGDTPLHLACRKSLSIVQLLVQAGANLNVLNNLHQSPMDAAMTAPNGQTGEIYRCLVAAGINTALGIHVNRDAAGNPKASFTEALALLQDPSLDLTNVNLKILNEDDLSINLKMRFRLTPKYMSRLLKEMLFYGSVIGLALNTYSLMGHNKKFQSLILQNILSFVFDAGADGFTQAVINELLNINDALCTDNAESLSKARRQIELLTTQYFTDVPPRTSKFASHKEHVTCLYVACHAGMSYQLLNLIREGDLHFRDGIDGKSLIRVAADNNNPFLIHLLAANGASIDAPDKDGNTPLHSVMKNYASYKRETVEVLLKKGADPRQKNKKEFTPLHFYYLSAGLPEDIRQAEPIETESLAKLVNLPQSELNAIGEDITNRYALIRQSKPSFEV